MSGETYVQRYAGGFADGSGGGTPVDAQFLNAVETALLYLLGEDPATNEVPVWNGTRFVFQKIANAQVDSAAAIDKTKLGSLAIADADVAGGAAIQASKISFAAGGFAIANLADPTTGKVIGSSGSAAAAVYPPGYQLGYGQKTSDTNVTATTSATATDLSITTGAVTYDGTAVLIHFFCEAAEKGTNYIRFVLYDGSTELGYIGENWTTPATINGFLRLTPTAASHTYNIRAYVDAGTGVVYAGAGTAGVRVPTFIRVTKV